MKKIIAVIYLMLSLVLCANAQNWKINDGIEMIKNKKFDQAVKFFEGYVQNNPNDAQAHYYLGLSYKNINEMSKSAKHLQKSYELSRNTSDITVSPLYENEATDDYLDMAQMYLENKDFKKALAYAELSQNVNPDNAKAYLLKAEIHFRQDDLPLAKRYMAQAVMSDNSLLKTELAKKLDITKVPPYDSEFYNSKGLEYYYGGDLQKAITYFKKSLDIDFKNSQALNNLAMAYLKTMDFKNAKYYLKKAILLDKASAQGYINLAYVAKLEAQSKNLGLIGKLKLSNKQENYLKKAIKINPNNKYSYYALGEFYLEQKDYQNAIANFDTAITIDSKYFEPYFGLAVCYVQMGDTQKALIAMRKAGALNSESAELLFYMAKLCLLESRIDEAREYLSQAVRKSQNPVYYMELGKIYYYKEDYSSALISFTKALELDMTLQNEAELYNYLGLCQYKNFDLDKAIYNLEKAVSLNTDKAIYLYNLAQVYKSNNQKDLYNKTMSRVASIKPQTPQDYIDLSTIYYDKNNSYAAVSKLEEGIQKFPGERTLYEAKLKYYQSVKDDKSAQEVRKKIKETFGS